MPSIKSGGFHGHGKGAALSTAATVDVSSNRFADVPIGRCRIIPTGDEQAIEAVIDGVCIPTGSGYGGWTVAARDGQTGVVEYTGPEPVRYTLPLLLDGWVDKVSVQDVFNALLGMAGGFDTPRPSPVFVIGSVPPDVDYSVHKRSWLIESLTPSAEKTLYGFDDSGVSRLMRQALTLVLIAPEDPDFVTSPVKKAQSKSSKKPKAPVFVIARTGDTLLTIAARNDKKWNDLALLNGIRDPSNLHAGQRIRIS